MMKVLAVLLAVLGLGLLCAVWAVIQRLASPAAGAGEVEEDGCHTCRRPCGPAGAAGREEACTQGSNSGEAS